MGKPPKTCPVCHSIVKWKKVDVTHKGISAGKAVVGGLVLGPVGAIVGGALGKKRETYVCRKCGFNHEY